MKKKANIALPIMMENMMMKKKDIMISLNLFVEAFNERIQNSVKKIIPIILIRV